MTRRSGSRVTTPRLVVMPTHLVDKERHRRRASQCGVRSIIIVVAEPLSKEVPPGLLREVEFGVGPFVQKGADEALGFAVGLRPIGPGSAITYAQLAAGQSSKLKSCPRGNRAPCCPWCRFDSPTGNSELQGSQGRSCHLLRSAVPGAFPCPSGPWSPGHFVAGCIHRACGYQPVGAFAACPGYREWLIRGAACGQWGRYARGRQDYAHSMVVDP